MKSFSIGICTQSLVSVYNLEINTTADHDLIVGLDLFRFRSSFIKLCNDQLMSSVYIKRSEICPEMMFPL